MTPGSIRGVRKKKCMQAHRRPRFPRPYLTAVLSPFARHRRSPSLSIYQPVHATTDTVAPPPLSTQGHPNAFPPPTTTRSPPSRPFPPVVTALPPMASPAQQRQPSTTQSKGVMGPFICVRVEERVHVRYTYASSKIIEKIHGESGVADVPPWRRRRHRRPRPSPRSIVIFFSPRGLCRECMQFSLALSRAYVATLHATFSTQANSSGNRKFEIEAPHRHSPSPPSSLFLPHHP